uniref:WAP domain-containing protein n=1 Tax=Periophthalmus magnuspinnatus TaxID=409849 RepID=A0A3B4AW30_9GOBI
MVRSVLCLLTVALAFVPLLSAVEESKPGSCPDVSPFFTTCKKECTDDSQCPENLKCCFSSCGLQCIPPEHGNSPQ